MFYILTGLYRHLASFIYPKKLEFFVRKCFPLHHTHTQPQHSLSATFSMTRIKCLEGPAQLCHRELETRTPCRKKKKMPTESYKKCNLKGQQDGSVGKGACKQTWAPEFSPWSLHGRWKPTLKIILWHSHLHCVKYMFHTGACVCSAHKDTHTDKKKM